MNSDRVSLARHYDSLALEYVRIFFDDLTDAPWLDVFIEYLGQGAHILDAGCGPGNYAKYLIARRTTVVGIDISKEMINIARSLVPQAKFEVMSFTRMTFAANTFDGIFCAYSFLHIPASKARNALHELRRVLKPGGTLCLMLKKGTGGHILPSPIVQGLTCFTQLWLKTSLLPILKEASFSLLSYREAPPTSPNEFKFDKMMLILRSEKKHWRRQ